MRGTLNHRDPHAYSDPAVVWMDQGKSFGHGSTSWLKSPLRTESWKVNWFPRVNHDGSEALASGRRFNTSVAPARSGTTLYQSAVLLPEFYRDHVNTVLAIPNSAYALVEIYKFSVISENQALNLIENKIGRETDPNIFLARDDLSLTNLLYYKKALDRRSRRLGENLRAVQIRPLESSSQSLHLVNNPQDLGQAEAEIEKVIKDFTYLLFKAQDLSKKCDAGLQIVMQSLQVRESKEQIKEAKSVTNLTRLAFVFAPLAFIASIFGINVAELGQGSTSIWVFFAVIAPVALVLVSLLFFHRFVRSCLRSIAAYIKE